DWRRPMKCQRKASPYCACFASRSCARFSPTTVTPASASAAMSGSETYLVAATIVTSGPTSAWMRRKRSPISSGDRTDDALDAAGEAVAAMREVEVGVIARADVDAVDAVDSRPAQRPLGGRPQIEPAVGRQVVVEEIRDLDADLVAAGADRGADDGGLGPVSERGHARRDDALGQPAPAGGKHRQAAPPPGRGDGDRRAVGRHRKQRELRLVRPQPVARRAALPRLGAVNGRRVDLPVEREPVEGKAERLTHDAPVLLDARRVIAGADTQVQRVVRRFADP